MSFSRGFGVKKSNMTKHAKKGTVQYHGHSYDGFPGSLHFARNDIEGEFCKVSLCRIHVNTLCLKTQRILIQVCHST